MDFEPHPKLERCDGIFCELSPEDKVRWIAATEEGREAIEKEHCIKNGLNWGTRFEEDGVFAIPPPPFGATRILSENNPVYSEPAPLTAPLIPDWSSRLKHRIKNGLNWGTMSDEDGVLLVPPPPFGATRILSENPDYSGPAPLTAPLITDWSSRLKREHFGEDWVLGPDGKWQTKTKTAKIEPLGSGWVRRPDGKWE
jgi:hypothetical protein